MYNSIDVCKLTLFGAPVLACNGRPRRISRRKAWALLAYLAVTGKSHTREALVAQFWPEYDRTKGHADLSRMLSTLRNALGADYFSTDRERVKLNEVPDLWVDIVHFRRHVEACREAGAAVLSEAGRRKLAAAAALYQDDFLAGFTLPGCPTFDEWQVLQTESLRRDLGWVLERLVHVYEADKDLAQATNCAERWVNLDPLHEPSQRRLMLLYARNGQRAAAHRQYAACERMLAEELGVEPQAETKRLHAQIRTGRLPAPSAAGPFVFAESRQAPSLEQLESRSEPEQPFVARHDEIALLDSHLLDALKGNGQIAFVTGGAGRGKTSLVETFAHRAQQSHSTLIVASGSGNAFAGSGDPYLPFREIMGQLSGDVATPRSGGRINGEQARRLWALLPQTAQILMEHGPQLLDVLVSGRQLVARAEAVAPAGAEWLVALQREVALRQKTPGAVGQAALLGQFTNVLHHLGRKRPLLLLLDDLQWIDEASIGMLFHLGRRLEGSRIFIVGAYRPDELPAGQNSNPHPLLQLLDEFRRRYGDVFIDLAHADRVGGRAFVDALLDSEPNQLGSAFREALFRQTEGHPLFTVELLRDLQSRGELVRDEAGQWCARKTLDWETFPARVEAVIARRVGRIDDALGEILTVASVEGELFTAEVVARVSKMAIRPLLQILSRQLERRERLVEARGEVKVGTDYLSAFRFSHALFQQYVYQQIPAGERRHLHGEVAAALSAVYAEDPAQIIVQLAHHYTAAADWDNALPYRIRAGDLAYRKTSLLDAVYHYQSALAHWPDSDKKGRAETLCKLGECMWMLGRHEEAIKTLEESHELSRSIGDKTGVATAHRLSARVYWETGRLAGAGNLFQQAVRLLEGEPESENLAWALAGMSSYHMHLSEYEKAIVLGERALAMARRLDADVLIIQCLCDLGAALSGKGDWEGLALEQESLARALALNRPHDAARAYLYFAEGLVYLGRYEEARETLTEALAYTGRMHLPYITEAALRMLAEVEWLTGHWSAALTRVQSLVDLSREEGSAGLARLYLGILRGRFYNDLGQGDNAYRQLTKATTGSADSLDPRVAFLGELARAEAARGRPKAAAAAASEIVEWTDQARYLFPNVAMALLFICRAPFVYGYLEMAGQGRSALHQLQRLDRQYNTRITTACRLEGEGWLTLAEAEFSRAVAAFEETVALWRELGQPYDTMRALSGWSKALTQLGDRGKASAALEQAMTLIDNLANQLEDMDLKRSFLDSALVWEVRTDFGRVA